MIFDSRTVNEFSKFKANEWLSCVLAACSTQVLPKSNRVFAVLEMVRKENFQLCPDLDFPPLFCSSWHMCYLCSFVGIFHNSLMLIAYTL